jgi:hypothetical protein
VIDPNVAIAVAKTAAGHAVKVDPSASPTTYVLMVFLGVFTLVSARWMKDRPKMFELFSKRKADIDGGLAQRVADLEARVDKAVTDAHVAQMQVTTLNAAFQLVAGELHRQDPNNPTLKLAREMIASAATTDRGYDRGIGRVIDQMSHID